MEQASVVRIVVASPSDVRGERDILFQVVTELNSDVATSQGTYLHLGRWESDSYPGFHLLGPQGLIDEVLKIEECDVLIGIFWKRFGTPVADAESGTAHEFRGAFEAWKARGRPRIMLYFNQEPYTPTGREDLEQWGRVLDFRKNLPKEGFCWSYTGKSEFEKLVRGHLTKYILSLVATHPTPNDPDEATDRNTEKVRSDPDGAEAEYREALRRAPDSAATRNNLGMALWFKGNLENAAAELREAIRLDPYVGYQHNNLGCVLFEQDNLEGAEVEFREAFRVDPGHAKAHANLAAILLRRGDRMAALEQFRISSRLRPDIAAWRTTYEGLRAELDLQE